MNHSKRLDSGQSSLSELPFNSQPGEVLDISPNSNNGKANTTEPERLEAIALKEEIIKLSREFFATLGQKLKYYRDRKLYRFEAKTFGQWCEQEIGLKRNYAYKLIAAFEVYDHIQGKMCTTVHKNSEVRLPSSEYQIRSLFKLQPDEQLEIWVKALDHSKNKPPSGKQIEQLVKEKERMERAARYQTQVERFKVGDVVRITAKYNSELKEYHHCWAQIISLEEFSYTVLTWKGKVSGVAHDDLMLLRVTDKDAAGTLLSQLNKIYQQKAQDSDCVAFLHYLGTKPEPGATSWAMNVLNLSLG